MNRLMFAFLLVAMLFVSVRADEPAPAPVPEQKPAEGVPAPEPAPAPAPAPADEQKPAEPAPAPAPAPADEQKPAEPAAAPAPAPASSPAPAPAAEQKPAEPATAPAPASAPASALAAEPKPAETKTYKTFELKSEPLKVDVSASAIVWTENLEVLKLQPKNWSKFEVESVVPHGTLVKKGDVVVKFKKDDYENAIQDQTFEMQLAEIAHERTLLQQKVNDITFQITMKTVKRKKETCEAKWEQTKKYDLELNRRVTVLAMASAAQTLENNKAELEQLERMYKKDELVEQSEEIVLKRQRLTLLAAQLEYDRAVARNDWSVRMLIPYLEEDAQDEYTTSSAQIDKEIAELDLTLRTTEIEKKKVEIQYARLQKKFNELKEDAKWFEYRAPADAIVLYGSLENGTWMNYAKFAAGLVPGAEIPVKTPFMTLVNPEKVFLGVTIAEGDFAKVAENQKGYFVANSFPDVEIPATVKKISSVIAGTEYLAFAAVEPAAGARLIPGMKGKITIAAVRKSNALLIPEATAARDDNNFERYVYVLDESKNEPVRRTVKVGMKLNGKLEILDGLEAGMKVLEDPATAE